jgi:hypothetical protein
MQTCKVTCPAWRRPSLVLIVVLSITAIPTYTEAQAITAPLHGEAADRLAIRELIDAYAHDADRRETEKQVALFTPDAILENIHNEPGKAKDTTLLRGQKDLAAGFATLKNFEMTMHFNGQSTIEIHGDTATGETYCLAHHIFMQNGQRTLMIIGIRYFDTMVRINGNWLFAKRQLNYDWVDRRPLNP